MARMKVTPTVRFTLLFLRVYLIGILAVLLVKFIHIL